MVCRLRKNEGFKGCRISASFLIGSKRETLQEQREMATNQHALPLVPVLGGQKGAKSACKKKKKKKEVARKKASVRHLCSTQVFCAGADIQGKSIPRIPEQTF